MAGGPLLPSSVYLGGASGLLYPFPYTPTTNTNTAGAFEGIAVIASLTGDAPAVMQFNMPETIPSGTFKLRILAMSAATTGNAKITVKDGNTAAGSNIGATTLNTDATTQTVTWSAADVLLETKINLTTAPNANDIVTVLVTFNTASWTLASVSVWTFSLVWE